MFGARTSAGRPERANDVKLSRGGIREIEFIVQLLLVVRGGQYPEIRTRSTLRALQSDGRIRYTGITHYRADAHAELERVLDEENFDWLQVNYSLAEREAEERLLPYCRDKGIAVMMNRPFADGALFSRVRDRPLPEWAGEIGCRSWGQFFLRFVVSHPAVTCAIPATSKQRHMLDNAAAGLSPLPDAAQRARMAEYWDSLQP